MWGVSDTAKRDAVVERFYAQHYGTMMGAAVLDVLVTNAMADRIVELEAAVERANRILAALREPSENVSKAVWSTWGLWDSQNHFAATLHALVRAAVAAAEQEVGR